MAPVRSSTDLHTYYILLLKTGAVLVAGWQVVPPIIRRPSNLVAAQGKRGAVAPDGTVSPGGATVLRRLASSLAERPELRLGLAASAKAPPAAKSLLIRLLLQTFLTRNFKH